MFHALLYLETKQPIKIKKTKVKNHGKRIY